MPRTSQPNAQICVCPDCFDDPILRTFVQDASSSNSCSFCGESADHPIAAPLEVVAAHIGSALKREYDDPANWLAYEGEYIGSTSSTEELLRDEIAIELPRDEDGRLLAALVATIDEIRDDEGRPLSPGHWCERDPYGLREPDQLRLSWSNFREFVMHRRRYFFRATDQLTRSPLDEILKPDDLLARIARLVVELGLVVEVPAGTRIYRARFQPIDRQWASAEQLGPPPPDRAKQNRMSPAGIVMFYGSDDPETAAEEAHDRPGHYAIGEFELLRVARILDLAEIPPVPSLFDEAEAWRRPGLRFLHEFAKDIARPIIRDDRVHIEYVPTQVMTEFFRSYSPLEDHLLDGIRYSSSRNSDGRSFALFATQENVRSSDSSVVQANDTEVWLQLVGITMVHQSGDPVTRLTDVLEIKGLVVSGADVSLQWSTRESDTWQELWMPLSEARKLLLYLAQAHRDKRLG